MKKFLSVLIICSLTLMCSNSYTKTKTNIIKTDVMQNGAAKQDSTQLKQAEVTAFLEQVVNNIMIKEFQQWCYKKMTAEKYDEFAQFYQLFLQQKFDEWVQQKKK